MNPKEVSKFPLWSDDWWIEDAQKRVDKLKRRMNRYRMSRKSFRANLRMVLKAQEVLYDAIWMKQYKKDNT